MIPLDILLTALIVAAAAVWAGRALWRQFARRRRDAMARACGGPQGGCGSCPTGEPPLLGEDASPCGDVRSSVS
jgi:hypothetical protein